MNKVSDSISLPRGILLALALVSQLVPAVGWAATAYEDAESATLPALPAGWGTTNSPAWSTTNVTYDSVREVGTHVLTTSVTPASTNSGWLTRGGLTISSNFVVDGFVKLLAFPGSETSRLEIALAVANGGGAPSAGAYTNGIGWIDLPPSGNWQHFNRSVSGGDVASAWIGATNVYLGFRFYGNTNRSVALDNVLVGDAFRVGVPEPYASGVLSHRWASTRLNTTYNWSWVSENATGSEPGTGAVWFDSRFAGSGQMARLHNRNLLSNSRRENVEIKFKSYNEDTYVNDWIQCVLTTNDWVTTINVGGRLPRELVGQATPYRTWIERSVKQYVPGLSNARGVRVGLLGIAGGQSGQHIKIDDVQVNFFTDVALGAISLYADAAGTVPVDTLTYTNDTLYAGLTIEKRPPESVSNLLAALYYRIDGGAYVSNALNRVDGGNLYLVELPQAPFEGGQTVKIYAECVFDSDQGTNQWRRSPETNIAESTAFDVESLGSVWINEIAAAGEAANQFVELSAPAGRSVAGWTIAVADLDAPGSVSNISVTTTFADEVNGYGFWVVGGSSVSNASATLSSGLPARGGVRLLNSAGLVEHSFAYGVSLSDPDYPSVSAGYTSVVVNAANVGLAGFARYETDWWAHFWDEFEPRAMTLTTPGAVNEGQGHLFPRAVTVTVRNEDLDSNALAYAACRVKALFNGGSVTTDTTADDSGVVSAFTLEGYNDTEFVPLTVTSQAFGYEVTTTSATATAAAATTNTVTIRLGPGPATDDFNGSQAGFKPFWAVKRLTAGAVNWFRPTSGGVGNSGCAEFRELYTSNKSYLYAKNSVPIPGGARCVDVRFDMLNKHVYSPEYFRFTLATNDTFATAAIFKAFPLVPHWSSSLPDNTWVRRRFRWRTESLDDLSRVWAGLLGMPNASGTPMFCDNLELAIGNNVALSDLQTIPAVLREGDSVDVSVHLTPWGASVEEVMPRIHVRRNTGDWNVSDMLPSAITLTNALTVTLSNAIPDLVAGETIEYYVSAAFAGASTNASVTYLPDNAVKDAGTGIDVVTGAYAAVPVRATVARHLMWINELSYDQAAPSSNFVELAGVRGVSLANHTLTVLDANDGLTKGLYTLASTAALTNGHAGICAFYVLGGAGVSVRDRLLTTVPLPATGGIALRDAQGNFIDAVSYGTNGTALTGYKYVGGTNGTTTHLYTTGNGPVDNGSFADAWVSGGVTTPAASNEASQTFVDTAPPNLASQEWELPPSALSTNEITMTAGSASDFSGPLTYRFSRLAFTNAFSTNRVFTDANGLIDNTRYEYVYTVQDSASNRMESAAQAAYTHIRPVELLDFGDVTSTSIVVRAQDLPNLGSGDSGVTFRRDNAAELRFAANTNVCTFDALGPNTLHTFTAQARNGDRIPSLVSPVFTNCTLALAPSRPIVKATGLNRVSVTVVTNALNPSYTEYAVAFTNAAMPGVTTYVRVDGSTTTVADAGCWQASWPGKVSVTGLTDTAYSFACRARNLLDAESAWSAYTNVEFMVWTEITHLAQSTDGSGDVLLYVDMWDFKSSNAWLSVAFSNSLTGASMTNAMIDPDPMKIAAAYGDVVVSNSFVDGGVTYQVLGIDFGAAGTNRLVLTWNTKTATAGGVSLSNYLGEAWVSVTLRDTESGAMSTSMTNTYLDNQPPVCTMSLVGTRRSNGGYLTYRISLSEPVLAADYDKLRFENPDGLDTNEMTLTFGVQATYNDVVVRKVQGVGFLGLGTDDGYVRDFMGNSSTSALAVFFDINSTPFTYALRRLDAPTTNNLTSVRWGMDFNRDALAVYAANFTTVRTGSLQVSGLTATRSGTSRSNYVVTVTGVTGAGDIGLSVLPEAGVDWYFTKTQQTLTNALPYNVNTVLPVASVIADSPLTNKLSHVGWSIAFDRPVSNVTAAGFALTGSGLTHDALVFGVDGTNYTVAVSNISGKGTLGLDVLAGAGMDAWGNGSAEATPAPYSISTGPLPGTIIPLTLPLTNHVSEYSWQVVFQSAVTPPLTAAGVTGLVTGALSLDLPLDVTGSGAVYTVTASNVSGTGTLGIAVSEGVVIDAWGNPNAAFSTEAPYDIRQTAPIGCGIWRVDPATNALTTLRWGVSFDREVTGLPTDGGALAWGPLQGLVLGATNVYPAGASLTYTVEVSNVSGEGLVGLAIASNGVHDAWGNGNAASSVVVYDVDVQGPRSGGGMTLAGGLSSIRIARTNGTVSATWDAFSDTNGVAGYYYAVDNGAGTSNGTLTAGLAGAISNVVQGTVTGFVWAVDTRGNIGTSVVSDTTFAYYDVAAFRVTASDGAASTSTVAGAELALVVTALANPDDPHAVAGDYEGTNAIVFFGATNAPSGIAPTVLDVDGAAIAFGGATSNRFVGGVAICTVALYRVENALLGASAGLATTSESNRLNVAVTVGPAGGLAWVAPPPTNVAAGDVWSNVVVGVTDVYGNPRTNDDVSVGLYKVFDGDSTLWRTQATVAGEAVFTGLSNTVAGVWTNVAAGISFGGTSSPVRVVVVARDAERYGLRLADGATETFAGVTNVLRVSALDEYANIATSYTGTNSLVFDGALAAPGGVLPVVQGVPFGSNVTTVFTAGIADLELVLFRAEQAELTASNTVDGFVGVPLRLAVGGGAPGAVGWVVGPPAVVPAGTNWTPAPQVSVADAFGNLLSLTNVSLHDTNLRLPDGIVAQSDTNGLAAFTNVVCAGGTETKVYVVASGDRPAGTAMSPLSDVVRVVGSPRPPVLTHASYAAGTLLMTLGYEDYVDWPPVLEASTSLLGATWIDLGTNGLTHVTTNADTGWWQYGTQDAWLLTVPTTGGRQLYYRIKRDAP